MLLQEETGNDGVATTMSGDLVEMDYEVTFAEFARHWRRQHEASRINFERARRRVLSQ